MNVVKEMFTQNSSSLTAFLRFFFVFNRRNLNFWSQSVHYCVKFMNATKKIVSKRNNAFEVLSVETKNAVILFGLSLRLLCSFLQIQYKDKSTTLIITLLF